ncbi:LysM peptidoglycan-binding domain-containing protein [Winogradskyella ouciana]|uniref:LysM peptidoglycan-binding domain-containing protein n=1 Tax=Winogradskyella ouciana TaxID=2608631 RepID=A0A7K1GFT0_9FLAO|nr:LysM peptidoglycan-binding domain-containing protein [Winogradskyella ouciana]MTE27334.1 LysM peptidoglycan-binding domain-containing protein [Winogradskyella ouciana]
MKNFLTIILFAFAMSINAQNYIEHKVKADETIESIAKKYMVTPFDIYALNPDAKSKFKPNTILIIPNSKVKNDEIEEESKELIGYKTHKVKRKETLYGISKKYSVTEEEIKKANRQLYSENLKKGDRIRIPKFKTFVSKQSYKNTIRKYKVQPKEGKWRVAYKFGITVAELEALNPNMKPILQPGDELNVPNIEDKEEKAIETQYNYYEVLPKEGFYRIKVKTGLTQEELENLNPELKEGGLKEGMVLKIPDSINTTANLSDIEITKLGSNLKNFRTKKLALMLPYRLNRIDTDSVEEAKSMIKNNKLLSIVLDFHIGVRMALDSAKQLGVSTDLKVLDTRYQPSTTSKLLADNDFSDYDAVIGPMEEKSFDRVATALRRDRVPVIAALNKPKEVYANVFQTIPDDKLLEKAMIDFVKKDSLKTKVVVIADQSHRSESEMIKKEFPSASLIYSQKNKKTGEDAHFIYPVQLENVFPLGKTIVFLETDNDAFASSVISMLNGLMVDNTEIVLVTLNKSKAFEGKDIDNNNLSNLKFHYPSVNKDFDEMNSNGFVEAYRKEYGVSPSKYVARGFDITLDVLLRLATEDNLYEASSDVIETEYIENKFRYNKSLFGGYTNEAVYIVKFDDLRIVEAN